jgi:PadR family transcriptional regulator PadR
MTDEADIANKKFQKELNAGTVALVLLSVLERSQEPMYGYQIAKRIEGRVEPSVSGPPRRYYAITPRGRETLSRWTDIWGRTKEFVDRIVKGISDV